MQIRASLTVTECVINKNIDVSQPLIIGVDEVGRGCLFGQMTVCACVLPPKFAQDLTDKFGHNNLQDTIFEQLGDSKKLSAKKRTALAQLIKTQASYAIIDVPAHKIDTLNIHHATLLGMKSAIAALIAHYPTALVLVDGVHAPVMPTAIQTLIKGDSKHASIAAASIVAKVHRDAAMDAYAELYPNHGLDKHKGYPTPAHKQALAQFGILPEHRRSYAPVRQILHNQSF